MKTITRFKNKIYFLLIIFMSNEVVAQSFIPTAKNYQRKFVTILLAVAPIGITYGAYEMKFSKDGGAKGKERIHLTIVAIFLATTAVSIAAFFSGA